MEANETFSVVVLMDADGFSDVVSVELLKVPESALPPDDEWERRAKRMASSADCHPLGGYSHQA